ncbi:MAG: hypothetical protein Sylvanvirus9_15 [Sylvanvirus sp.]|uniref:Uncharacterized protein n=1 Tax=Sylvanvirus sp. TaxID=2487774 RepID=A0A3G5AHU6_9VIRU|nr:MAG: hypothetical protein Sylvanvirus9_15 [Sylvanvirus sp.]
MSSIDPIASLLGPAPHLFPSLDELIRWQNSQMDCDELTESSHSLDFSLDNTVEKIPNSIVLSQVDEKPSELKEITSPEVLLNVLKSLESSKVKVDQQTNSKMQAFVTNSETLDSDDTWERFLGSHPEFQLIDNAPQSENELYKSLNIKHL